jgi:hypothetical protein
MRKNVGVVVLGMCDKRMPKLSLAGYYSSCWAQGEFPKSWKFLRLFQPIMQMLEG